MNRIPVTLKSGHQLMNKISSGHQLMNVKSSEVGQPVFDGRAGPASGRRSRSRVTLPTTHTGAYDT